MGRVSGAVWRSATVRVPKAMFCLAIPGEPQLLLVWAGLLGRQAARKCLYFLFRLPRCSPLKVWLPAVPRHHGWCRRHRRQGVQQLLQRRIRQAVCSALYGEACLFATAGLQEGGFSCLLTLPAVQYLLPSSQWLQAEGLCAAGQHPGQLPHHRCALECLQACTSVTQAGTQAAGQEGLLLARTSARAKPAQLDARPSPPPYRCLGSQGS